MPARRNKQQVKLLPKSPTGIAGLDEVTGGGLPKGRPTLIAGGAGTGKTLFAMEFLVNGAVQYDEPGVFVAFEETAEDLVQNVESLGFDLKELIKQKKLWIEFVRINRNEIEEAGEYDLEALFIRLGHAIEKIGARRIALDTIEFLFATFPNHAILRAELQRLFRWLKEKEMTAVVTAERGDGSITRFGLEEYVADAVIVLDHRVNEQVSTRRLRIVKYRGSLHGTNEYPFLIGEDGITVLPITSLGLEHEVVQGRVSSGVKELDAMLGGQGFYRGSTILITGSAGTGKTSLSASFVDDACKHGDRCLYFAFEESPSQIQRNMRSIGIDLEKHVKSGLLQFHSTRPTLYGLEMHLVRTYDLVNEFKPDIVILDPINDFFTIGNSPEVKAAITRIVDFLKTKQITGMFTSITSFKDAEDHSVVGISSLIDTWITLRNVETNGERQRALFIMKSRGMPHSNQVRTFDLSDNGIRIGDVLQSGFGRWAGMNTPAGVR